jgi:hypothetical protein
MGTLNGREPALTPDVMSEFEDAGVTWWLAQSDEPEGIRRVIAAGPRR